MRHIHPAASVLLLAASALGQATIEPDARAADDGRPAPAAERLSASPGDWWQHAVFYEVFVRSFADSVDPPLGRDGIGDLRGLMQRLDYLNDGDPSTSDDLGVTGLWLMPICESPSYHGYDVTDFRRVHPDYGTNEDFLTLMDECRRRGIRVITDLVLNHVSSEHPWFRAAAAGDADRRDWFIWQNSDPGWRGPWGQQVWQRERGRDGSFYGIFYRGMPDLNYANPAVTAEMLDVTRFWLDDMRSDGFRLDAVRHLIEDGRVQENTPATHAWLARFHTEVRRIRPEALTVGEIWSGPEDVSRYVGDQVDIAFEFSLADAIIASVREQNAGPLTDAIARVQRLYPPGMYATFLRNHDQPRTAHELGGSREAAGLAAAIQFALPGVPFIYYGEEIGMSATKPDPMLRTPMQWDDGPHAGFSAAEPWAPPLPDRAGISVAEQSDDPGSLLSRYRLLIRVRGEHEALRTGRLRILTTGDDRTLVLLREGQDTDIACIFNLSVSPVDPHAVAQTRSDAPDSLWDRPVLADLLDSRFRPRSLGQTVATLGPRGIVFGVLQRQNER